MNFEIAAQGMGGKYVLDGTDNCAAMFNPEGDAGDVEMWELICPMTYLSRRIKANTGGAGRHRGGSSFESLLVVHGTEFWELQNLGSTRILASGLFGGYPGPASYVHNIKRRRPDRAGAARRGLPTRRRRLRRPGADGDPGRAHLQAGQLDDPRPFAEGDLYLSVMKGGPGLGDPLLRPVEQVERDVEEGHLLAALRRVDLRRVGPRRLRRQAPRAGPARAGVVGGRARAGPCRRTSSTPIKVSYAESMQLSPAGRPSTAASGTCRRTSTSTSPRRPCPPPRARSPARSPRRTQPTSSSPPRRMDEGVPTADGGRSDQETLEALLDEKLSRREVKDIQSGYKDADRFEKWLAVLQERASYDDPIVLPMGEGLNIGERRADGAGHPL